MGDLVMLKAMASYGYRMVRSTDLRLLWKIGYNFGYKGMLSVQKFKARLKEGKTFPPFIYISITNSCNLRSQGCWVKDSRDEVAALQHHADAFPGSPSDASFDGRLEQHTLLDSTFQERTSPGGDSVRQGLVCIVSVLLEEQRLFFR